MKPVEDWPGPGRVRWPRYEEGVQRNMYAFYADMMRAAPGEWPSLTFAREHGHEDERGGDERQA